MENENDIVNGSRRAISPRIIHGGLTIRTVTKDDEEAVRKLIFTHVRSQIYPAAKFWIFRNFSHLSALFLITLLFVSVPKIILIFLLFFGYLFLRSKYEFEEYIKYSCEDLKDIHHKYIVPGEKHFWVAEYDPSPPTTAPNAPPSSPHKTIVGCIGIGPLKEDPTRLCQIYRLVVSPTQRRLKVGTHLLATLESFAQEQRYEEVRMIANNLLPEVHYFYKKNGYEVLYTAQRGLMRGDLVAYRKFLGEGALREENGEEESSILRSCGFASILKHSKGGLSIREEKGARTEVGERREREEREERRGEERDRRGEERERGKGLIVGLGEEMGGGDTMGGDSSCRRESHLEGGMGVETDMKLRRRSSMSKKTVQEDDVLSASNNSFDNIPNYQSTALSEGQV